MIERVVVGLGNPGEKYKYTRHNVGFSVLNAIRSNLFYPEIDNSSVGLTGGFLYDKKFDAEIFTADKILLVKPQTFMNESGKCLGKIVNHYKIKSANLMVVHDDLDIRLGEFKIQLGRGPKLHYGIRSIEEKLTNPQFWRLRIGVENRQQSYKIPGEDYVLQNFSDQEVIVLNNAINQSLDSVRRFVGKGSV